MRPTRTLLSPALVLLLAAGSGACTPEARSPLEIDGPSAWGGAANVAGVEGLWFASQPDRAALELAKQKGVRVVVNLREAGELDWNEQAAVSELGMTYYHVPVSRQGPFKVEAFERIEQIVEGHDGEGILLHCASGNRAAGWFVTHLVRRRGMGLEEALAVGRAVGMTGYDSAARAEAYLNEHPAH